MKIKIDIKNHFGKGHYDVKMPDGNTDDYLNAIISYYARINNIPEEDILDSGEMEGELVYGDINNERHRVKFYSYNVELKNESWEEKVFLCTGSLLVVLHDQKKIEEVSEDFVLEDDENFDLYFVIKSFIELEKEKKCASKNVNN